MDVEIMASIETVVQNADAEPADEHKPDSTAEVKDEPGIVHFMLFDITLVLGLTHLVAPAVFVYLSGVRRPFSVYDI